MKLTQKEIIRRIKLCKDRSVKQFTYGLIFIGTIGFCLKCNNCHAGECSTRR